MSDFTDDGMYLLSSIITEDGKFILHPPINFTVGGEMEGARPPPSKMDQGHCVAATPGQPGP